MNRPYLIGLTGSIGMGKSTTAAIFRDLGCEVWDADAAVHRMYGKGGAGVLEIQRMYPEAVQDGAVSRGRLKQIIKANERALSVIESIVHPLVRDDRYAAIAVSSADIFVCDIPLLFEAGIAAEMDMTVVVTAPAEIQRNRVMARSGMTEDLFASVLANQMPDQDKRDRADHIIETLTIEQATTAVVKIVNEIRAKHA